VDLFAWGAFHWFDLASLPIERTEVAALLTAHALEPAPGGEAVRPVQTVDSWDGRLGDKVFDPPPSLLLVTFVQHAKRICAGEAGKCPFSIDRWAGLLIRI
jgi:hypothetical protein